MNNLPLEHFCQLICQALARQTNFRKRISTYGNLESITDLFKNSRNIIVLTGAGVSTSCGIPDFRSPTGLWTRFSPQEYATIDAFMKDPERVWRMLTEMERVLDGASPNPGHRALAELETGCYLDAVITQNIDGLHQRAGNSNVVEFHGSHLTLTCQWCGNGYKREELDASDKGQPARCACGGRNRA